MLISHDKSKIAILVLNIFSIIQFGIILPAFSQKDTTNLKKYYVDKTKKKPAWNNPELTTALVIPAGCSIFGSTSVTGGSTSYYYDLMCDDRKMADYWTIS